MTADEIADPDGFVRRLIENIARRLVRQGAIDRGDQDDVGQDLFLALLARVGDYDAKRGTPAAFCRMVLASAVRMMLRARRAAKRSRHRVVGSDHTVKRMTTMRPTTKVDVGLDVQAAVACVPDDLRDLACRLTTRTRTDVARDLRIPRTTLNRRVDRLKKSLIEIAPSLGFDGVTADSATTKSKISKASKTYRQTGTPNIGRVTP